MLWVLVHPLDISAYHVITHHMIHCAMDRNQRRIGEFVALSGKKKSNTGARLNITSKVIIIDCSDDSDSEEIEATTCLSVSADVPVRQFSDSDIENEVDNENEEEIQLVPQVSAVKHQSVKKSNEETVSEALVRFLEGDVDMEHLKVQLCMLPDTIKTAFDGSIKRVTNVRTIADVMMKSEIYQSMLCEVNKVLLLYFTFPVTTSTAERSFSSLRRIKTYLQIQRVLGS